MTLNDVIISDLIKPEKGALVSGPFGSNISSKFFVPEGVPVIRGNNLTLGKEKYVDDGYVFITEQKAHELRNCIAVADDIIFTAAGTLGQVGIIPTKTKYEYYIISNKQIRLRLDVNKCDPLFAYYYLSSPPLREFLISQNKGSSVPLLTLGIIRKVPLRIPDKETQTKVAAILSAYDDLIENNKRRIALLEKMAEEIYREWFVRFRFPGYQTTEFEKGIPKDWDIKKLGDILELSYGKALKVEDRVEGDVPVYGSSGVVGYHDSPLVKRAGIIVGRKGNVGSVFWSEKPFFPIDTVYFVESGLSNYFLYYLLQSMNFINNDAAVPGLNRNQAYSNELLLPEENLIQKFEEVVKPIFEQARLLRMSNDSLLRTKDMLLPRLISGKLSVAELDIQFPPSMSEDEAA